MLTLTILAVMIAASTFGTYAEPVSMPGDASIEDPNPPPPGRGDRDYDCLAPCTYDEATGEFYCPCG
jgi:hypothetical protein